MTISIFNHVSCVFKFHVFKHSAEPAGLEVGASASAPDGMRGGSHGDEGWVFDSDILGQHMSALNHFHY